MNNIASVVLISLPPKVKGFTVKNDDDTYTVFLNVHHTIEAQREAMLHELEHINRDDWNIYHDVNSLEMMRHG